SASSWRSSNGRGKNSSASNRRNSSGQSRNNASTWRSSKGRSRNSSETSKRSSRDGPSNPAKRAGENVRARKSRRKNDRKPREPIAARSRRFALAPTGGRSLSFPALDRDSQPLDAADGAELGDAHLDPRRPELGHHQPRDVLGKPFDQH